MESKVFRRNRMVSVLLALCMVLTLLPGTARAEEEAGTASPPALVFDAGGNEKHLEKGKFEYPVAIELQLNCRFSDYKNYTYKVYAAETGGEAITGISCTIKAKDTNDETSLAILSLTIQSGLNVGENGYYIASVNETGAESSRAKVIVNVHKVDPKITATSTKDDTIVVTLANAKFDATEAVKPNNWGVVSTVVNANISYPVSAVTLNSEKTVATLKLSQSIPGREVYVSVTVTALEGVDSVEGEDNGGIGCTATISSGGSETTTPTITATATRSNGIVTAIVTVTGATFDPTGGVNKENWGIALTRVIELTSVELNADRTQATLVFPLEDAISSVIISAKSTAFTDYVSQDVYGIRCEVDITDSSTSTDTPDIPPVIDIPFIPSTPSTGGTSTGSTPSTDTTTDTTPDGSSTTTKTDAATGTVTETTKGTDGSETVVETKTDGTVTTTATDTEGNKTATTANPDGSAVTTIANKDGGASTTTVSATGQVTAAVTAPAAAVAEAQTSGQAVPLPMPEVPLTADASAAPIVTVTTGSAQPVKVEIPVEKTTPGTVAVIVKADGTEEVVKTSLATDTGVTLAVPDGATVKIVDNSKSFADAASHWAGDAITFATAHELFNGTGADSFTPNGTMTRGMMVTVLARYDGVDTSAGATWYEKGVEWAAENNISSGADLDAPVSREQLAAMLYRYAAASGLDTAAGSELTGFADAGDISGYAAEAMAWAVGAGLIGGTDMGELNPSGSATRAEVATILMRFCENVMK